MRELVLMSEGKQKAEWDRTSLVCTILANANRSSKTKAFKPDDFNPYSAKKTSSVINDKSMFFDAMKAAFVKGKK